MTSEIELDDLSKRRNDGGSQQPVDTGGVRTDVDDGVVAGWAWVSSGILLLTSGVLLLFPRLLLFLCESAGESADRRAALTPLEAFLALNTGLLLGALGLALPFHIPPGADVPVRERGGNAAAGHPFLVPVVGACVPMALLAYNATGVGTLGLLLALGAGTVGLWGLWAYVFAGSGNISRKTGADKRTSRFLFGNKSAAAYKKKLWKKEQAR